MKIATAEWRIWISDQQTTDVKNLCTSYPEVLLEHWRIDKKKSRRGINRIVIIRDSRVRREYIGHEKA